MDKRLIETKKTGICNFDYFCVDSTAKDITMNGKTSPHGRIAWEVSMLGKEYITELLLLGGYLRQSFLRAEMCSFQIGNYIEVRERNLAVIDFVKDTPPFSHFDTQCSRKVVEDVFSDEHLKMLEHESQENPNFKLNRWYQMIAVFVNIYMYLCTYTANFATFILNFTQNTVEQNCRDAKNLANLALIFFSIREVADLLEKSNSAECAEGVTLRPRATIVPAIPFDANMPDAVEIKNRRTATAETKANKQAAADNPYHILWKKCGAAIRKRRSRGTISEDECAKAQAYAKDCYDRAKHDTAYAAEKYEADMKMEQIFKRIK